MHISDLLRQYNKAGSQSEPITKKKGVEKFSSPLSSLSKGNIFEGTVTSIKGNQVILGLSNGQQITARMDAKLSLVQGQSMFFQVRSNDGNQIAIRPFTVDGSGANYTLLEALKTAGLPTEQEYVQMVNKMMEEQMSIDRASLQSMARVMQNANGIDVNTLVQLQKLNLPITPEFASQYENYLGDRQSITWALDQFINELPEILADENLSPEEMTSMGKEILDIVTEGLSEEASVETHVEYTVGDSSVEITGDNISFGNVRSEAGELNTLLAEDLDITTNSEKVLNSAEIEDSEDRESELENPKAAENEVKNPEVAEREIKGSEEGESEIKNPKVAEKEMENTAGKSGESFDPTQERSVHGGESLAKAAGITSSSVTILQNSLGNILSDEEIQYLNGQLKVLFSEDSSGFFSDNNDIVANGMEQSEAEAEQIETDIDNNVQKNGSVVEQSEGKENDAASKSDLFRFSPVTRETSVVSVLNNIKRFLEVNPNADKKALTTLFSGKEFKQMIKDSLDQQWTIKPKALEGSDKINRLYEHLENQIDRMENIVKVAGQPNDNIANLAANIRDNVEFMSQINQAYTYVQIPLKMSGQSASGQLYVFTNKKNLEQGDRELSAFLHLDMDNLGSTDISVKMYKKDVTTNFYMDTDEAYDLIRQFIPQLEARLKAKGYNSKIIVSNEAKKVNFVEDFLKKDQPSAGKVHRYSFDMRA